MFTCAHINEYKYLKVAYTMLASLTGYNMLSNINKNVNILVINPSKYFTDQDVGRICQ